MTTTKEAFCHFFKIKFSVIRFSKTFLKNRLVSFIFMSRFLLFLSLHWRLHVISTKATTQGHICKKNKDKKANIYMKQYHTEYCFKKISTFFFTGTKKNKKCHICLNELWYFCCFVFCSISVVDSYGLLYVCFIQVSLNEHFLSKKWEKITINAKKVP